MAQIKHPLMFYGEIENAEQLQIEENKREEKSALNKQNHQTWYDTPDRWINRHLFQNSKKNAKAKNIPHTLTLDSVHKMWEEQNGRCAISGVPLTWGKKSITNASIDQIYPSAGYHLDNVWLVCLGMNTLKMEYSLFELVKIYPDSLNSPLFRKVYNDMLKGNSLTHNDSVLATIPNLEQIEGI
jgi:hypothetical protein